MDIGFCGNVWIAYISFGTDGIFAIGFAIFVVIDLVVADFGLAICGIGACIIVTIEDTIGVVIDVIIADFGIAQDDASAPWIIAIDLVVAVVVDIIVTNLDAIGVFAVEIGAIAC